MSSAPRMDRVVVIGTEGARGKRLAEQFSARGADVVGVAVTAGTRLDEVPATIGEQPIDLLIFADDWAPPDCRIADIKRADLAASLDRLAFTPFRLAALLRPALAAAGGGKLVLLSRESATMGHVDKNGRYLERPFRAAMHALWRCLSVEWRDDDIDCVLIALDDGADPDVIARLPDIITAASSAGQPVTLMNGRGDPLRW